MVNVVIQLNEGFTLQEAAAECCSLLGLPCRNVGNVHELMPWGNTGIDPWSEGGYLTCRMDEEHAAEMEATTPTTFVLSRVEWPDAGPYEPITFVNGEGQAQQICAFSRED